MIASILLVLVISNLVFATFLINKLNDLIKILFECFILIYHTIVFIFDPNLNKINQSGEKQNIEICELIKDCKNLVDLSDISILKHKNLKSVGKRKVIQNDQNSEHQLGEYKWLTYEQLYARIFKLSRVLYYKFKLEKGDRVVIMADTCQEWLITFFALLKLNVEIISIDKKLDDETIRKILIQLNEIKCIFIQSDLIYELERFCLLNKPDKKINLIIYDNSNNYLNSTIISNFKTFKFDELINEIYQIKQMRINQILNPDDVAIVLFTNDSPNGVQFTHSNLVETIKTYINFIPFEFTNDDTVLCYLPLSNSFELIIELVFFTLGIKLAYARPSTLFNYSTESKSDLQASDASILPCVPLILDRIKKQIKSNLKSPLIDNFYDLLFEYKKIWSKYGYKCDLTDEIFYEPIKKQLYGSRLKHVLVSGALPIDTQIFIKLHLNVQLSLIYASTETLVCCLSTYDHTKHSNKMTLINGIDYEIKDLEEGDYEDYEDQSNSIGELIIGSKCVSVGYFNNKNETDKYFQQADGLRWFSTGDIAKIYPDGIEIIDCKRDLIKLQNGYCISLSKLEKIYYNFGFVNYIVLHANLYGNFLIAIIQPKKDQILKLAATHKIPTQDLTTLYEDRRLKKCFLNILKENAKLKNLIPVEIPDAIKLCNDNWQSNSLIESSTLMPIRSKIYSFYKDSIDKMYLELDQKFSI